MIGMAIAAGRIERAAHSPANRRYGCVMAVGADRDLHQRFFRISGSAFHR